VDGPPAGADRQQIMQFMTTEHFTVQTARVFRRDMDTSRVAFAVTAGEPTGPDHRS
jgi:hypothetical protein